MTDTEGTEYMRSGEARELLGVTFKRMAKMLDDGTLPWWRRGINQQIKWVKRADVERMARELHEFKRGEPRPKSRKSSTNDSAA